MKTEKQRSKPWNPEEKRDLEHTKLQAEIQLLSKMNDLHTLEEGQEDLDEEIEWNIAEAKAQLKGALLTLGKRQFDRAHNITKKEVKFKIDEAKLEISRLKGNINAIENQIKKGKPILDAPKSELGVSSNEHGEE